MGPMASDMAVVPARDARFWLSPEERAGGQPRYQIVDQLVDSVRPWFDRRRERLAEYLKYYGISYEDYGQSSVIPHEEQLRFNVCEPIVDAAVNKVCKSRIVPMAITVGGSAEDRTKAKNFNRFISGLFMELGLFEMDYALTTEAFVGDCAIARVVEDNGRVKVQRCDPNCVYFDPEESVLTGRLSWIAEDVFIDRWKLVELVKRWDSMGKLECSLEEALEAVLSCNHDSSDHRFFMRQNQHDVVMLREAWHAKSDPDCDDGCHIISIKGKMTLVAEEFGDEEVPHEFLTRKVPLYGVTSPGLMCSIIGGQKEYDEVTERLRLGHRDIGIPRVAVRRGAVNLNEINNHPNGIVEVDDPDGDIRPLQLQPAHPDVYTYRKDIFADLQITSGVPDMSLSGKPPEGVTANSALSTLDDLVAEKLSQPLRCRERFFVRIGEKALRMVGQIAKRHRGKYVVKAEDGRVLDTINWKDVNIPFGSFKLKCFPTNFLSQTPSVRYQRLTEMLQNGQISEIEWRALSEIPDLEHESDLKAAPQNVVDKCIEAIMTKGTPIIAEAFDDHGLIIKRGMSHYNIARLEVPDRAEDPEGYRRHQSRMRLLADYINSAANWMKPPPPPPNTAGVGQPSPGPEQAMDMGMVGMVPPPAPPQPGGGGDPMVNPYGPPPADAISNGMY